ncbi:MAG: ElyC/SanA/YdcF family protein [Solirubrobacterales bacterium]
MTGGQASLAVTRAWRPETKRQRRPRMPRSLGLVMLVATIACTGFGLAVVSINLYMSLSVRGAVTTVADAQQAQAAIVLGAAVNPDRTMSVMLADRVARGAELYAAGKVDRVIVSGDHGRWAYDEPGTMRRALRDAGVPPNAIFTDHAGFNTWASMVRARKVFGVRTAIVVTQGFHLTRALYLAEAAGLSAGGVRADARGYGAQGRAGMIREVPARVKAFGSALFKTDVLLGPEIPVSGDGRESWGPPRP